MSEFANFEMEDLSAAFEFNFNEEDLANAAEGLELCYQEDDAPGSRLVEQRLHRNSFVQFEFSCGDSNTIYQPSSQQLLATGNGIQHYGQFPQAQVDANSQHSRKRLLSEDDRQQESAQVQKMIRTTSGEDVYMEPLEAVDSCQTKERKCMREKQRRAELNNAFNSLARTISLPIKCNKTVVIQKAESTIIALRKQVNELMAAKLQHNSMLQPGSIQKREDKLPPWILAPLLQNVQKLSTEENKKPPVKVIPNTPDRSILDQMKATVQNMQRLYEKYEKESRNGSATDEITHSHCA